MEKKIKIKISDIISDKASRRLNLPESINNEFNEIKNFGCYSKFFGRDFFHSFYSLAIAYATKEIKPSELKGYFDEDIEIDKNPNKEKISPAIDNPQLEHHDYFFKTIAYWYAMKNGDEYCYRYIIQTNESRKFCEELFYHYYKNYLDKLRNLSSEIPNIALLNDLD